MRREVRGRIKKKKNFFLTIWTKTKDNKKTHI